MFIHYKIYYIYMDTKIMFDYKDISPVYIIVKNTGD